MNPQRPEFTATFRYIGRGAPIVDLKRLLKNILRVHGFKCRAIVEAPTDEQQPAGERGVRS